MYRNIGLDVPTESMESNEPLLRYKWGNEEWVQCKVFSVECKRRAFRITYAMYDHKYAGSYLLWHQDNFLEEREKTFCMNYNVKRRNDWGSWTLVTHHPSHMFCIYNFILKYIFIFLFIFIKFNNFYHFLGGAFFIDIIK